MQWMLSSMQVLRPNPSPNQVRSTHYIHQVQRLKSNCKRSVIEASSMWFIPEVAYLTLQANQIGYQCSNSLRLRSHILLQSSSNTFCFVVKEEIIICWMYILNRIGGFTTSIKNPACVHWIPVSSPKSSVYLVQMLTSLHIKHQFILMQMTGLDPAVRKERWSL